MPLHNPSLSIIRLALYALYLLLSPDLYQRFGQKKSDGEYRLRHRTKR
ncbi:hypothetical protein SGH10_005088 [Klebsiella pneumoniae]|nr:hypothetical protein SGH10_005088 [Klebsiella pneumoniae]CDK95643.1 hypothetical protein [Klebsiella pneumoniae IS33]